MRIWTEMIQAGSVSSYSVFVHNDFLKNGYCHSELTIAYIVICFKSRIIFTSHIILGISNEVKEWEGIDIYFFKDSANGPDSPWRRDDSSLIFLHESAYWINKSQSELKPM